MENQEKIKHLEKQLYYLDKNKEAYGKDYLMLRNYYVLKIGHYKKSEKITPEKKKIYNNTYRLKKKSYRVNSDKKTIYCHCADEAIKVVEVKNLLNQGFVLQLEIN